MKKQSSYQFGDILLSLRPTAQETKNLIKLEKEGDREKFNREFRKIDKKYATRTLQRVPGLKKGLINPNAFKISDKQNSELTKLSGLAHPNIIASLLETKEIGCDCLIPFKFDGLKVYGSIGGPESSVVARGMLGAVRWNTGEYSVFNPGDTTGKTRVHVSGQLYIRFNAFLPKSGRYCLLIPAGALQIKGSSRVVGHGNFSTSFDAKAWVDFYSVLQCENQLLELSGGEIHYDATRSEDRTKFFEREIMFEPRYIFFTGNRNDEVLLTLRLEVDTAANEDGISNVMIDQFGFLSNATNDHNTLLIKT